MATSWRGTITAYFGSSSSEDRGDGKQPAQKRTTRDTRDGKLTSVDTSRHVVGYNQSWETEFSWLVPVHTESEEKVSGMLCSLCKRHSTNTRGPLRGVGPYAKIASDATQNPRAL